MNFTLLRRRDILDITKHNSTTTYLLLLYYPYLPYLTIIPLLPHLFYYCHCYLICIIIAIYCYDFIIAIYYLIFATIDVINIIINIIIISHGCTNYPKRFLPEPFEAY